MASTAAAAPDINGGVDAPSSLLALSEEEGAMPPDRAGGAAGLSPWPEGSRHGRGARPQRESPAPVPSQHQAMMYQQAQQFQQHQRQSPPHGYRMQPPPPHMQSYAAHIQQHLDAAGGGGVAPAPAANGRPSFVGYVAGGYMMDSAALDSARTFDTRDTLPSYPDSQHSMPLRHQHAARGPGAYQPFYSPPRQHQRQHVSISGEELTVAPGHASPPSLANTHASTLQDHSQHQWQHSQRSPSRLGSRGSTTTASGFRPQTSSSRLDGGEVSSTSLPLKPGVVFGPRNGAQPRQALPALYGPGMTYLRPSTSASLTGTSMVDDPHSYVAPAVAHTVSVAQHAVQRKPGSSAEAETDIDGLPKLLSLVVGSATGKTMRTLKGRTLDSGHIETHRQGCHTYGRGKRPPSMPSTVLATSKSRSAGDVRTSRGRHTFPYMNSAGQLAGVQRRTASPTGAAPPAAGFTSPVSTVNASVRAAGVVDRDLGPRKQWERPVAILSKDFRDEMQRMRQLWLSIPKRKYLKAQPYTLRPDARDVASSSTATKKLLRSDSAPLPVSARRRRRRRNRQGTRSSTPATRDEQPLPPGLKLREGASSLFVERDTAPAMPLLVSTAADATASAGAADSDPNNQRRQDSKTDGRVGSRPPRAGGTPGGVKWKASESRRPRARTREGSRTSSATHTADEDVGGRTATAAQLGFLAGQGDSSYPTTAAGEERTMRDALAEHPVAERYAARASHVTASEAGEWVPSTTPASVTANSSDTSGQARFPSVREMLQDPQSALRTVQLSTPLDDGDSGPPRPRPSRMGSSRALDVRSIGGPGSATPSVNMAPGSEAASVAASMYEPQRHARVQLSRHVAVLSEATPIHGTAYVRATMRLTGVSARVFRDHLMLKIVGAFAEVLSLRVPSLADEDVDIVGAFNLGSGSAVTGLGTEKLRAPAKSTTSKMNDKKAYAFKLALEKTVSEAGDMTEEQHKEHKKLLHQAKVQEILFGPLDEGDRLEAAIAKERKRAAKWRAQRQASLRASLSRRRRMRLAGVKTRKKGGGGGMHHWPTAMRVNKMKESEQALLRRTSVDRALEKVTSLMSALGGEDSLLAHIFLTSDLHSIPVAYPKGFYKASNWEGRCLQTNPVETGQAQLTHAYSGRIAAHNARTRSMAMVEFGVRVIVKEEEALIVDAIFRACMTEGYLDLIKLDALHRNPPPTHKHALDVTAVTAMLETQRASTKLGKSSTLPLRLTHRAVTAKRPNTGGTAGNQTPASPPSKLSSRASSRERSRGRERMATGGDGAGHPRATSDGANDGDPIASGDGDPSATGTGAGEARLPEAGDGTTSGLGDAEVTQLGPSTMEGAPASGVEADIRVAPLRGAIEGDDGLVWAPGRQRQGVAHPLTQQLRRQQRQQRRSDQRRGDTAGTRRKKGLGGRDTVEFERGVRGNRGDSVGDDTVALRKTKFTVSARLVVPTRSSTRAHDGYYGQAEEEDNEPTCRRCRGTGCMHRSARKRHRLALRTKDQLGQAVTALGAAGIHTDPLHLHVDPSIHRKEKERERQLSREGKPRSQLSSAQRPATSGTESSAMNALSLSLYVGDKTPILHATAPNLMRVRLKMQHGLPLESSMLNTAVEELQELSREATYAKRHMEMSGRHAVQEFYKAKAKLKHCKQAIRAYFYEVED